jgi:hypothetical protein
MMRHKEESRRAEGFAAEAAVSAAG